jgi:cephalosporin hydroxylase
MTLWSDFLNHNGRTAHKWRHYFPAYEQHFNRYVNRPLTFIEIGCGRGGSLQLWKRYFGPHAQIIGIDIHADRKEFQEDQIAVRIGSQADEAFLAKVIGEFGAPDVVLDDGSHHSQHMLTSFQFLYPRMARDGVYMVEDANTTYSADFGGGLRKPGAFMEVCKDLIDELNADCPFSELQPTDFTRTTQSMHFYDSIVAFERGRTLQKTAPLIPLPPEMRKPSDPSTSAG